MPLPTTCPSCGAGLESGSVVGQGLYLNWIEAGGSVGWVAVGKEHLATGSFVRPPMLAAVRCRACGLGIFEQQPGG